MNRLNKIVKALISALFIVILLIPNNAITSNAEVRVGKIVSKNSYISIGTTTNTSTNVLLETGSISKIYYVSGYKLKNVKSSSKNLKLFISKNTDSYIDKDSNSMHSELTGYSNNFIYGYAKKPGNYTVSFTVVNANGTQTLPRLTIKVRVKDNVCPFKKVTFAGKSLWNYEGTRLANTAETFYTTKKSGKLVVKPASGYKIKKIEIGAYNAPETKTTSKSSYTSYSTKTKESELINPETGTSYRYDEYDKYIDKTITYKKVKSGKKISLSTMPYISDSKTDYKSGHSYEHEYYDKNFVPTYVRITYMDKATKLTYQWENTIYLVK